MTETTWGILHKGYPIDTDDNYDTALSKYYNRILEKKWNNALQHWELKYPVGLVLQKIAKKMLVPKQENT